MQLRGYVANRGELASLLGAASSDAELIAKAYRRWGDRLHNRVEGGYAAAVMDERDGSALLTHDRTALGALFYALDGDGVRYASHLIDLAHGGPLDEDYLADYLTRGFADSHRTPYDGVRRLMPGESIVFERGRARVIRTWDPARLEPVRYATDADYEERLRELLDDSVAGACAGARAWSELSGGLDSSTNAALAARHAPDGFTALSYIFGDTDDVGEERWMRAVVEMYELRWERVPIHDALPFSEPPGSTVFSEPSVTVASLAMKRRTDGVLADHGVEVLLSGGGGDAVLCSATQPRHLADPLFRLHPLRTARDVARWRREHPEHRSHLYWAARHVAAPALDHLRGRAVRPASDTGLPPWFEPGYRRERRLEERRRARVATRCPTPGMQDMWDGIWTLGTAAGIDGQREKPHELRHPLLNARLVEFMLAIPWDQKLRPDCNRYLQRRALRGILPEEVRRRAGKAGFTRPLLEGLRTSREWLELLTDSPQLAERGIVPLEAWREAVSQARFGRTHTDKHFMAAVSLEAWLQQHAEWRIRLRSG